MRAQMPPLVPAEAPPEPPKPTAPVGEPTARAEERRSTADNPSDAPLEPGYGHLTVHSSNPSATVYVMLKKYGLVEQKLLVPCAQRFVSIGFPARNQKEPVWLAPGKMIQIPCGQSTEVTMNPRTLR